MNVMKQDAMDDKIIERCKTCEKQCMQEGLDRLRSRWAVIELTESIENYLDRLRYVSRIYQEATQKSRWIENLSRMSQVDRSKVFQERKNTQDESNKIATQTSIQAAC